jgi:outer membrane receptor protein involved in Fe transport
MLQGIRHVKSTLKKVALCSATCIAALTAAATSAQAQSAADAGDEGDTIIVTGSRIARPELASANPVVTVTDTDIVASGTTNLTDYLQTIPALQNSFNSFDTSGDRAGIGTTGLNLLNLRNLGAERTLVLVDGRRHVAGFKGLQAVDINTIPTDLVERVEVFTGGASAIYGADGVSGVVNFIQKKDFEGLTARVQNGISQYGDAGQRLIALTAGHNFAQGRGNFAIAWEHGEEDRLSQQQRKRYSGSNRTGFYLNSADTEGPGQNNDGIPDYIPLKDVRYFDTSRAGGIDVNFDRIPDFYGAQGLPFDPGTTIYNTGNPMSPYPYRQGGDGTLVSDYGGDLLPKINRDVVNAVAHFDFSDAFTLYAEGKYADIRSYTLGQPTYDYYLFIPADNPYIPDAVAPYINPFAGGVLVNRDNFDLGRRGEDIDRKTIRTVIGAKGDLSPHLSYDVSYVYGRTKVASHYVNAILSDRFYAAIDAVDDGNGGVTCRANLDPNWTPFQPGVYTRAPIPPVTFSQGDCVPLNIFGEGAPSQAAIDWIKADVTDRSKLTQHVVSGALTGDTGGLFELPGGAVGFAVGGEYRKEKSSFTPDPLVQQGLIFGNALGSSKGDFDVWEAFAELDAPLLADMPFAHRLDLNAAVRYSDYSTVGSTTAWKFGGSWAPVSDITFRGSYSRSVRAPNISELFGATSQTFLAINDPCDQAFLQNGTQYRAANCAALLGNLGVADPSSFTGAAARLPGLVTSNPDLKEEIAKTLTAGVVLQPSFIPRLVITADWYDITIDDAINTASPGQLAALCVDQASLDNAYCSLISRQNGGTGAGQINGFMLSPFNVASFKTSGLDFAVSYAHPTASAGTFGARVVGNYLNKLEFVPVPGAAAVNQAYVAGAPGTPTSPKFQITTDLTWAKGPLSFDWQVNYASGTYRFDRQTIASNPDIVAPEYLKYKARFSHDLSFTYEATDQFEFYGGVNNLFNQKPSFAMLNYAGAASGLNTPVSAVGRFFFVGARVKLADLFGGAK